MKVFMQRLAIAGALLTLWTILAKGINPLFVPSPQMVADGVVSLFFTGQLLAGILYSLKRVVTASVISCVFSLVLGILSYSFKPIRAAFYPAIKAMRYIPVTAFYPLLIMWCGIEEQMKITFLTLVTFVSMMPAVMVALSDVNPDLIDTGKTLGMNRYQIIRLVILPDSLPSIFENFSLLIAIGWTYVPFVETINAKYGLGYIIHQSSSRGRTDLVFAAIAMIMIISVLCDKGTDFICRRLFKWRYLRKND